MRILIFYNFFVKNCQKIPGVFINIYRKDKILLRNYMKLSIIILVKTLPQTLPKTIMFAKTILILNLLGGFKMKKKLVTVLLASSMVATMLAG